MRATVTLAFDVYGTLVDPAGMAAHLARDAGERAAAFADAWRDKQLEYSFRRGLMRHYADFATCTAQALAWTAERFGVTMDAARRDALLRAYLALPAFADARPALDALRGRARLWAFSNGTAAAVEAVLANAGLRGAFEGIVSVDDVKSFKPDPAVYAHARRATGAWSTPLWLVSGNPFDVIGARAAGLEAAWVRRDPGRVYDPWDVAPTATIASLAELPALVGD